MTNFELLFAFQLQSQFQIRCSESSQPYLYYMQNVIYLMNRICRNFSFSENSLIVIFEFCLIFTCKTYSSNFEHFPLRLSRFKCRKPIWLSWFTYSIIIRSFKAVFESLCIISSFFFTNRIALKFTYKRFHYPFQMATKANRNEN